MKKLVIICLCVFPVLTYSQDLHTRKGRLIERYEEAKSLVQVGNLYQSLEIINEVLDKDDSFDEAIMLKHEVLIKRDDSKQSEELIYVYQEELETIFLNRLWLIQANYDYQLGNYQKAKELINKVDGAVFEITDTRVSFLKRSIDFAINQSEQSDHIEFEKLPFPLNESEQQYFPSIAASGQLIFTVRDRLGRGDEDIYTSSNNGSEWSEPELLTTRINTERNEGTASISADGNTLVFTSCNRPDNIGSCDLYISYKQNGDWTSPELLDSSVNSPDWDSQPSLSANGKYLYFVSRRPGGFGKQDIWKTQNINGRWTAAENLGQEINTAEDDCSPFIYLDGETLIYSTRGRIGMGGFDLFKSSKDGGLWSQPENLGAPINNAFDQVGYCISADRWAYFSSSDVNGKIFLQRFKVPESIIADFDISDPIIGKVVDANTNQAISADVEVITLNGITNTSTDENGSFRIEDQEFSNLITRSKGYRTRNSAAEDFLKDSTVQLIPFEVGESLLDQPLIFDFDRYKISDSTTERIEAIANLLKEYPELKVEILGYTDTIGNAVYNLSLSKNRARSVYDFLLDSGVSKASIVYRGLGEIKVLQSESNNAARKVEIIIRAIDRPPNN